MVRVRMECLRRPLDALWREERGQGSCVLELGPSGYRHRNLADQLQEFLVVVASCALAMEDLFGMSLFKSMPLLKWSMRKRKNAPKVEVDIEQCAE
jgi:hypothetical protein